MLPHPVGTERALSPPIIRNRGKPVASPPNPNTTPFLIQPTAVCPACVSVPSGYTKSPQDRIKRLCTWLHILFQSGPLLCSSWALTTPVEVSNTAAPTRKGTYPGPNTARARYWINRAVYAEPGEFSSSDLQRMYGGGLVSKARAPIDPFSPTPFENMYSERSKVCRY